MQGDVTWRMFKQLTCSAAHYFIIWGGGGNHNQSMSTTWTYFIPLMWFCRTVTNYPIKVSILQFIAITICSYIYALQPYCEGFPVVLLSQSNKHPSWKSKYVKFNVKMHQHRYASSRFTCLALKDAFSTNVSKIHWIFRFYLCTACGKQDFICVWN